MRNSCINRLKIYARQCMCMNFPWWRGNIRLVPLSHNFAWLKMVWGQPPLNLGIQGFQNILLNVAPVPKQSVARKHGMAEFSLGCCTCSGALGMNYWFQTVGWWEQWGTADCSVTNILYIWWQLQQWEPPCILPSHHKKKNSDKFQLFTWYFLVWPMEM